jgi:hypothetical protein
MADGVSPALIAAFSVAPPPDQTRFTAELRTALRQAGWTLGAHRPPDRPMSFEWWEVATPAGPHTILLKLEGRAMALASGQPAFGAVSFSDAPEAPWPAFMLPGEDLRRELTTDDLGFLRALSPSMTHNVSYWRPRTVGAAIFNYWD